MVARPCSEGCQNRIHSLLGHTLAADNRAFRAYQHGICQIPALGGYVIYKVDAVTLVGIRSW